MCVDNNNTLMYSTHNEDKSANDSKSYLSYLNKLVD